MGALEAQLLEAGFEALEKVALLSGGTAGQKEEAASQGGRSTEGDGSSDSEGTGERCRNEKMLWYNSYVWGKWTDS